MSRERAKENRAKARERKQRYSLTLLFTGIVFIMLAWAVIVAAFAVYLLVLLGVVGNVEIPEFRYIILFMALISVVIGFTVAFFSSKIPLKPVNKWVNHMNRLADGDFSTRISFGKPFGNHPTFLELTDSFNKLAQELENTEMLREDFINNLSHEVKTPIVSIAGFAKLLKRGDLSEEQKAQYLDAIEEESLRLSYMATNVLNLTKVENQAILSEVSDYNLSEQIRFCALLLEDKWTKKGIELQVEFDEYSIEANEELLKQVWINLLDNAVKFSPDGDAVSVTIKENDEDITVSITNASEPIPQEKIAKIWNKFYQTDESHSTEGNGIGLAIVKKIVSLHKGNVRIVCENGKVTFVTVLPKMQ